MVGWACEDQEGRRGGAWSVRADVLNFPRIQGGYLDFVSVDGDSGAYRQSLVPK